MAEENVKITVSDEELDAAIAKIEVALEKRNELVNGQTPVAAVEGEVQQALPTNLSELQAEQSEFAAFWERQEQEYIQAKANIAEVDAESDKITGVNLAARRVLTQIPGLREAYFLVNQIRTFMRVSPEIAVLLAAVMIITTFLDMQKEAEKKAADYEVMIKDYRGFTTHREFEAWQEDEKRRNDSWRNSVIP